MKNKLIAMTLMATMAISLIACGKDNKDSDEKKKSEKEATTTQTEIEYNVDDYVTLGDYKGIEVTLDGNYQYTDEGFDEYVQSTINSEALFVEDSSQTEIKEVSPYRLGRSDAAPDVYIVPVRESWPGHRKHGHLYVPCYIQLVFH